MRVVWKSVVPEPDKEGIASVKVPDDAQALTFAIDNDGNLVVWYMFEYERKIALWRDVSVKVVNTGEKFSGQDWLYRTTVITKDWIVWHCFTPREVGAW
jgi:hypothetical protein